MPEKQPTEGIYQRMSEDVDVEGHAMTIVPKAIEDDVEGHAMTIVPKAIEDDVEGHSFTYHGSTSRGE